MKLPMVNFMPALIRHNKWFCLFVSKSIYLIMSDRCGFSFLSFVHTTFRGLNNKIVINLLLSIYLDRFVRHYMHYIKIKTTFDSLLPTSKSYSPTTSQTLSLSNKFMVDVLSFLYYIGKILTFQQTKPSCKKMSNQSIQHQYDDAFKQLF